MAMTFVKRSAIPAPQHGRSSGPSVSVTEAGQVAFNGAASKHLGGRAITLAGIAHDPATGKFMVVPKGHKSVAKVPDSDMFAVRWNKEKDKKGKDQAAIAVISSMSFLLRENKYDYKASGQQSFPVEMKDGGVLEFTLPSGSLTPKPKTARKPKATAVAASAASAPATEVPQVEELVLEGV